MVASNDGNPVSNNHGNPPNNNGNSVINIVT